MKSILAQTRWCSSTPLPLPRLASSSSLLHRRANSSTPKARKSEHPISPLASTSPKRPPPPPPARNHNHPLSLLLSTSLASSYAIAPDRPQAAIEPNHPSNADHSLSDQPPSPYSPLTSVTPHQLLTLARALDKAPPPSIIDLSFALELSKQAEANQRRSPMMPRELWSEVYLRLLAHASRVPSAASSTGGKRDDLAPIVVTLLDRLKHLKAFVNLALLGLDVKRDLLPLAQVMRNPKQIDFLAQAVHAMRTVEFDDEERRMLAEAMERFSSRSLGQKPACEDWQAGFRARLEELIELARSQPTRSTPPSDSQWIFEAKEVLGGSRKRGHAIALLLKCPVDASSLSESLVVASQLYDVFAAPSAHLWHYWRQSGEAIVRLLLLFSNHTSPSSSSSLPSFDLLTPALQQLLLLPPSFIPSTSSFPSFALFLLPCTTTPTQAVLVVDSLLHAQPLPPALVPQVWKAFLAALERPSTEAPLNVGNVVQSPLFRLVQSSSKDGGASALQELMGMYQRRSVRGTSVVKGRKAKKRGE